MRFTGNGITNCYPDEVEDFISITVLTVTKEEMDALALVPDAFHGEWNYKLLPR